MSFSLLCYNLSSLPLDCICVVLCCCKRWRVRCRGQTGMYNCLPWYVRMYSSLPLLLPPVGQRSWRAVELRCDTILHDEKFFCHDRLAGTAWQAPSLAYES